MSLALRRIIYVFDTTRNDANDGGAKKRLNGIFLNAKFLSAGTFAAHSDADRS